MPISIQPASACLQAVNSDGPPWRFLECTVMRTCRHSPWFLSWGWPTTSSVPLAPDAVFCHSSGCGDAASYGARV